MDLHRFVGRSAEPRHNRGVRYFLGMRVSASDFSLPTMSVAPCVARVPVQNDAVVAADIRVAEKVRSLR